MLKRAAETLHRQWQSKQFRNERENERFKRPRQTVATHDTHEAHLADRWCTCLRAFWRCSRLGGFVRYGSLTTPQ